MKRGSLILSSLVLGGVLATFAGRQFLQGQAARPDAIPAELTSYRDVVKKVLPAVVSIEARAKATKVRRRVPLDDERIPEEFRKFFRTPRGDDDTPHFGFGSGFIVDPKGVVLTNFHVVDHADRVVVRLADGRKFVSTDVKADPKSDLAIVRFDAKGALPFLQLGDSDAMQIGDRVLAVGAPFGLDGTVTHGIISAKGRSLKMNMYEDFIQTDAAINPGNSGGPLVNLEGKVIGINAAIKSRSGGWQGIGLAVSSDLARSVMKQLLEKGVVRRGYLGVQIKDLDNADLAARLGVKAGEAVEVTRVFPDTPGSKAGLKSGDVIVSLGGKPIKNGHELQTFVARAEVGKRVEVGIVRDGKPQTLSVTVEEQPQTFGNVRVAVPGAPGRDKEAVRVDKIGVQATDLTAEMAEEMGFKEGAKGVVVVRVKRDSVADEAGLRRGMVITKVDKKSVADAEAFKEAVEAGSLKKGVLLQVKTPEGGTSYVLLKAAAASTR